MLQSITLKNVLPAVFAGDPVRPSDVWLTDLTLHRGGQYLIEAGSGTGKSSLCSFLYGARTDYQGEITFDGTDIRTYNPARWQELRRTELAYLPQELGLFPELTAMQNVMLKNRLTDAMTESEIMQMFEALEVDFRAHALCGRMSVGQQQRVAIVRTLCQPFSYLLLDEPVSHLDDRCNAMAARLITDRAAQLGAAVIVTSVGARLTLDFTSHLSL